MAVWNATQRLHNFTGVKFMLGNSLYIEGVHVVYHLPAIDSCCANYLRRSALTYESHRNTLRILDPILGLEPHPGLLKEPKNAASTFSRSTLQKSTLMGDTERDALKGAAADAGLGLT